MIWHWTCFGLAVVVAVIGLGRSSRAFVVVPTHGPLRYSATTTSKTGSWGRKRGGNLGDVDPDLATTKTRASKKSKNSDGRSSSSSVSPDLANWLKTKEASAKDDRSTSRTTISDILEDDVDNDDAATFIAFDSDKTNRGKSNKKDRPSTLAAAPSRNAEIDACVQRLETVLAKNKKTLDDIMAPVRQLLDMPVGNLQALVASSLPSSRYDYRLAWVGSDATVGHLCTGLHKVPLARLQEVFISLLPRSRLELSEVIRILGPFPNVKNVLHGRSVIDKNDQDEDSVMWTVTWDSMIDGTGKELLAGAGNNTRTACLHVYLAHPKVLLAVVPADPVDRPHERRLDPLQDNGAHALLFVAEEQLAEQLEALRVS